MRDRRWAHYASRCRMRVTLEKLRCLSARLSCSYYKKAIALFIAVALLAAVVFNSKATARDDRFWVPLAYWCVLTSCIASRSLETSDPRISV